MPCPRAMHHGMASAPFRDTLAWRLARDAVRDRDRELVRLALCSRISAYPQPEPVPGGALLVCARYRRAAWPMRFWIFGGGGACA